MNAYENKTQAQTILDKAQACGISAEKIIDELKSLHIEVPSWAFAETGTRFGKFYQKGAAATIEEKIADAAMVHKLTGICPSVAVHVLWDFPKGANAKVVKYAEKLGVRIGAINPNIFQDQNYKFGSLTNKDEKIRQQAIKHCLESIRIAKDVGSKVLSIWLADGTNFPGQEDVIDRRNRLADSLKQIHKAMPKDMMMAIEYKPFEPASYFTDVADWGMSYLLSKKAGPQAKVLVDIGHHYTSQNIEQIVAWLIEENMLGGFHFNDRRYADDDLTTGSIDPYQMFRIFHEIITAKQVRRKNPAIAYMVDESHGIKPKLEEMIQSIDTIHQSYAKALLVDRKTLRDAQAQNDVIRAEE
ncbi:MAG: TIM barrel protein, partial [Phycisphaerae bacterium]|nr:TIM barrel protein [Phycisphaerae bacterium]